MVQEVVRTPEGFKTIETGGGITWKEAVTAATTGVLPANTRVGNVLTGNANGALAAQDGVTLVLGEDLLVKNEAAGQDNGIYELTQVGDAGSPYILTRRSDADTNAKVQPNMTVPVSEGTANADTAWTLTTNAPIVLNTTVLVFADVISGVSTLAATLTAGNSTGGSDIRVFLGDAIIATGVNDPIPLTPGAGGEVQANGPLQVTGDVFPSVDGTLGVGSLTNAFAVARCNSHQLGIEASAATITVGTNGRILCDANAVNVDVDLPAALAGLEYHLLVSDATNGVDLTPDGTDEVNGGGAGVVLVISVVGRYIVTCIDGTDWICNGPIAIT